MLQQLAINTNTYHGFTLEEAIKGAKDAGFSKIELAVVRDHTSHVLPDMSTEQLQNTKKMLKDYGMTCIGVSAHSNVMQKEGVKNLLESIDLAVEFDCKYIVTATGDSHDDADVIEDFAVLAENLHPVLEKCAALDKTLVLETHGNNFATGESIKSFISSLTSNEERVRITYDTGNVLFYGNTQPYEDLESTVDYVEFIHLKDKKGPYNEWNFPAIGDGAFDFNRITNILKKGRYKGPISVEVEFTSEGPENLEEVNRSVKKSYQYLSQILTSR